MSKIIGVIGSRSRDGIDDYILVGSMFYKVYEKGDSICSGLCPKGGDRFAVELAKAFNLPDECIIWYPANWKEYGRKAGMIRNTDIAKMSDMLIACVSSNRKGGTEDTIKKFIKFKGKGNLIIIE